MNEEFLFWYVKDVSKLVVPVVMKTCLTEMYPWDCGGG